MKPMSWRQLSSLTSWSKDYVNGPTNAQSKLRLFGQPESSVRVTLFRDNHAWCPYCQKIWLFLEEKRIPYKIGKVTMFCYGDKEPWYLKKVGNGMLPAIELDGHIITESDEILAVLESQFGPLGVPMRSITQLRQLERNLFRAWCGWACYPAYSESEEAQNKKMFQQVLAQVDRALTQTAGPFFLDDFSMADVIFVPYVERMLASNYYYKGFDMKQNAPAVARWFAALEQRDTYRGTQSDMHTHVHDLPPQMGGMYENKSAAQQQCMRKVDQGPWIDLPDCGYPEPEDAVQEVIARVVKHKDVVIEINCIKDKAAVDEAMRCALTTLVSSNGEICGLKDEAQAVALRYIRDRVNVPRDMSIWAGRRFRDALEKTAATSSMRQGPAIPVKHRRDQNPVPFVAVQAQYVSAY
eukprot:gnl/MRDRNA2_/MRDRNA2_119845_c0_seq1.p1 gnl/MRDRNA2_/MRDRNA2_119845_c0~~gnl/MRDRNA2_/MRDRNA2_119845_c0_seq1.p1  ORF type:complete len:410 (-),score=84.00 gnl/MRDRNA2_/MRDRNA2_119845_c0_seq1:61-1290(-)